MRKQLKAIYEEVLRHAIQVGFFDCSRKGAVTAETAMRAIHEVESGQRVLAKLEKALDLLLLSLPENTPKGLTKLTISCWHHPIGRYYTIERSPEVDEKICLLTVKGGFIIANSQIPQDIQDAFPELGFLQVEVPNQAVIPLGIGKIEVTYMDLAGAKSFQATNANGAVLVVPSYARALAHLNATLN